MPSPIRKIINKVRNWWNFPPCPLHGQSHLFKHGDGKVECMPCFNRMLRNSERIDHDERQAYLNGERP